MSSRLYISRHDLSPAVVQHYSYTTDEKKPIRRSDMLTSAHGDHEEFIDSERSVGVTSSKI